MAGLLLRRRHAQDRASVDRLQGLRATEDLGGPAEAVPARRLRELLRGLWVTTDYPQPEAPIFASKIGTPLGHRNVTRRGFEAARDEAKLDDKLTFHDLRHAAASRLIAAGIDDELIADRLGHEDSSVTRRVYAHVYDRAAKAEAVRKALQAPSS